MHRSVTREAPRRASLLARLRRLLPAGLLAATALTGSLVATAGPAAATLPQVDRSDCGFHFADTQPTSTTVRVAVRLTCDPLIYGIHHGLTVQRSGKVVGMPTRSCKNSYGVLHFSCTIRYSVYDPAGSQKFEILDDFQVFGGVSGGELFRGTRIWTFYS